MTTQQRRKQGILGLGCLFCVAVFVILGLGFISDRELVDGNSALVALWWGSAIAGLTFGVAACRVDDDDEKPEYLGSILRGLLDEWRRTRRTS